MDFNDVRQLLFVNSPHPICAQHLAGLVDSSFLHQPPRDSAEFQKASKRKRRLAPAATPSFQRHPPRQSQIVRGPVVGEVGEKDPQYYIGTEIIPNRPRTWPGRFPQCTSGLGRRIHRWQDLDEPERTSEAPIPREGQTQRGNYVEHGHQAQAVAPAGSGSPGIPASMERSPCPTSALATREPFPKRRELIERLQGLRGPGG